MATAKERKTSIPCIILVQIVRLLINDQDGEETALEKRERSLPQQPNYMIRTGNTSRSILRRITLRRDEGSN